MGPDQPRRVVGSVPAVESAARSTGVDLDGLLTVLGNHLYSTPSVAVRELVQNAHDSLTRRRYEDGGWDGVGRIELRADTGAGLLVVSDEGAGLTESEIHRFLATIGRGYTRVLRESQGANDLIGLFGLGFLSAFVVAERVEVHTTSFTTPGETWCYASEGGQRYTVTPAPPRPVGTTVTLRMRAEHRWMADPGELERLLSRYVVLLDHQVWLAGADRPVNADLPPWRTDWSGVPAPDRRARLETFAAKFERAFAPLCFIEVRPTATSDARGLLWVQDGATYATSDNRNLAVFVRGMLLDDNARELLPDWAGFVGGVIESSALTPTASREDLQRDAHYQATKAALETALIEGLAGAARSAPADWRRVLSRHNEALLGASLCDPRLFDILAEAVRVPTSQGDLGAATVAARGGGRVHVVLGGASGFEEMLFHARGVPVARGDRYAVRPFLARYAEERGHDLVLLGTDAGNATLFEEVALDFDDELWLMAELAGADEAVVAARFEPTTLPLVVVPDREAELKRRIESDEADARIGKAALHLARMFTSKLEERPTLRLYVNVACPAVQQLLAARAANPAGAALGLRLVRSVKSIMAASTGHDGDTDLGPALSDLGVAIAALATGLAAGPAATSETEGS